MADIDEIIDNFSLLDEWDDRYRYLDRTGAGIARRLPRKAHNEANKVRGCASQVWLDTSVRPNGAGGPVLHFSRRQRCPYRARADRHPDTLRTVLHHRKPALFVSIVIMASAFVLLPFVGRDFFPSVDSGQIRLHKSTRGNTHRKHEGHLQPG